MMDGLAIVAQLNPDQNPGRTSHGGLVLDPFYRREYRSRGPRYVDLAGRFVRDWHGAAGDIHVVVLPELGRRSLAVYLGGRRVYLAIRHLRIARANPPRLMRVLPRLPGILQPALPKP